MNFKMKKYLYIIVLTCFCSIALNAQHDHQFCGTKEGRSEWLRQYQANPSAYARSSADLWVPVQIHNVGTDTGGGFYSTAQIMRAFCDLQASFEPTGIRFYMTDEINYVYSSKLYYHETFQEADTTAALNYPDVVNVYIAQEAAGNCGYAAFWSNTVVLAKGCIVPGTTTWAHEMGHVLSLPHNFDTNTIEVEDYGKPAPNGYELVDGSNCREAGDGFCDTPPDYLGFRWPCDENNMSLVDLIDPNNAVFKADGYYIMSYANDGCSTGFSNEQMDAMNAFVIDQRPGYIANEVNFSPITDTELQNIAPKNGDDLIFGPRPTLYWDAIEHASWYIIEMSRFENFIAIERSGLTQETSFEIEAPEDLIIGKTYYWRVRPYNNAYTCQGFFPVNSFVAQENFPVNTTEIDLSISAVQLTPNPSTTNSIVNIQFSLNQSQDVDIKLLDIMGQLHQNNTINGRFGKNTTSIDLEGLAAGMYYVAIGDVVEKLVVGL